MTIAVAFATGGVVQLAAARGARVTALARPQEEADHLRRLGITCRGRRSFDVLMASKAVLSVPGQHRGQGSRRRCEGRIGLPFTVDRHSGGSADSGARPAARDGVEGRNQARTGVVVGAGGFSAARQEGLRRR
ncbi:hypothetical protein ACQEU3_39105 [Spirillospora sp. CA-253888]